MAKTKPKDEPAAEPTAASRRTSVSELAKMLAERRSSSASSVTLKVSAQGVFMPEVTVVANEDDAIINTMVRQASDAYIELLKAAGGA